MVIWGDCYLFEHLCCKSGTSVCFPTFTAILLGSIIPFLSWGKWSPGTRNHSWVRIQWNTEFTLNHPADPLFLSQNSVSWSITSCHSHRLIWQMLLHTGVPLIRGSMQFRKVQSLSLEATTTASSQIVVLWLLPVPCSTSLGTGKYCL